MAVELIYLYSNEVYQKLGYFKVGKTSPKEGFSDLDRVYKRVNSQKTSSPHPLNVLQFWRSHKTEKEVHDHLISKGILKEDKGGGEEWFLSPNGEEEVKSLINELLTGVNRTLNFEARPEQKQCISQANLYFNNTTEANPEFLMAAKPRFGKVYTTLKITQDQKDKKTLVITYQPYIKKEWADTINNHVDFSTMKMVDVKKFSNDNPIELDDSCHNVVFSSVQDLLKYKEKSKWKNLVGLEWDTIVFDELDWGSLTPKTIELLLSIKTKRKLGTTGTPFKLMATKRYHSGNTFSWTYEEEQEAKREEARKGVGENYKWCPELKFYSLDLAKASIDHSVFYDKDGQFTMDKFFEVSSDKFTTEPQVLSFLDAIAGNHHSGCSPYANIDIKHSIWVLPSVSACHRLKELLAKHPFFKDFIVLDVTGSGEDYENSSNKILGATNNHQGKKSITLTVERHLRGTTIPKWDSILILANILSISKFFQMIFRVQSPNKVDLKTECYVFDYDFNRTAYFAYQKSLYENGFDIVKAKDGLKRFFDCAPILKFSQNRFQQVSFEMIWQTVSNAIKNQYGMSDANLRRAVNVSALSENSYKVLTKILKHLKIIKRIASFKVLGLNTQLSGFKGKNTSQSKDYTTTKNNTISSLQELGKDIISDVRKYILCSDKKETSVEELCQADPKLFKEFTGLRIEDFNQLVEDRFFDIQTLNEILWSFYQADSEIDLEEIA